MREIAPVHLSERSNADAASMSETSISRRIASPTVELERREVRFAADAEAEASDSNPRRSGNPIGCLHP